ncbi:peroxisome biogenesis protein 22 [Quercus suber]
MTHICFISTSTVHSAASPNELTQRIELTPWDLQLLLVDHIQKGILFFKPTPSQEKELKGSSHHATLRPSVVEVLLEISRFRDIYLIERILDDESGERVLLALENAGLFKSGGLMKDKVLFCSTDNGRLSFVRQLEPDWHVDTNPDTLSQLAKFIRFQLYISPSGSSSRSESNIFNSKSLESFFNEDSL